MTFFQTLKNAIIHPTRLNESKNLSIGKTIIYVLLLTLFTAIPITLYSGQTLEQTKKEALTFFDACPNFNIAHGTLNAKGNDGMIYQGKHLVLSLDPKNKQTASQLQELLSPEQFGISFTKKQLLFTVPKNHIAEKMMPKNPMSLNYQEEGMNGLTKEAMVSFLNNPMIATLFYTVFLIFAFIPSLISLLSNLIMTGVIAWLYCKMTRVDLKFRQIFKLTLFSTTLPALLGIVVQLLFNNLMMVNYIYALNLIIFFFAIKNEQTKI